MRKSVYFATLFALIWGTPVLHAQEADNPVARGKLYETIYDKWIIYRLSEGRCRAFTTEEAWPNVLGVVGLDPLDRDVWTGRAHFAHSILYLSSAAWSKSYPKGHYYPLRLEFPTARPESNIFDVWAFAIDDRGTLAIRTEDRGILSNIWHGTRLSVFGDDLIPLAEQLELPATEVMMKSLYECAGVEDLGTPIFLD